MGFYLNKHIKKLKMKLLVTFLCIFAFAAADLRGRIFCRRPCPMILDPVCATNGETYSNMSAFENSLCGDPAKIAHKIDHAGACTPKVLTRPKRGGKISCDRPCPMIYWPVCGSDGVTYGNECTFEDELCRSDDKTLKIVHQGACKN